MKKVDFLDKLLDKYAQKVKLYPDTMKNIQFNNQLEQSEKFYKGDKADIVINGENCKIWIDTYMQYKYEKS